MITYLRVFLLDKYICTTYHNTQAEQIVLKLKLIEVIMHSDASYMLSNVVFEYYSLIIHQPSRGCLHSVVN